MTRRSWTTPARLRVRLALVVVAMALVAAGCSSGGDGGADAGLDEEPARAAVQDLRVAVGDDPFNPTVPDIGLRLNGPNPGIFERLTTLTPTFGVAPGLATRWESPSPTVWRFTLRPNVLFHDGTPLNGAAAAAALNVLAERQTRPRGVEPGGARAAGDLAVEITLSMPNARLPEQLAAPNMGLASPGTRPGVGDSPATTPTGTGPFTFVSYTPGSELKVKANERYWGEKPALTTLTFRFGPPPDASRLLATRQVDVVGMVPYQHLAAVSGRTDRRVSSPAGTAVYLLLNTGGIDEFTTLKDDNVRKAVVLALDRKALAEQGFAEHGDTSDTLIPPLVIGEDAAERVNPPARDVPESRRLLDQAGWAQGPDGMRSRDGRRLVLSVLLSRPADHERAVEVLRSQLTEVGIGLQVQEAPEGVFTQVRRSAFDLFLEARGQDDANPCGLCRLFSIRPGGQLDYATAVGGGARADELFDRVFEAPSVDTARRLAADMVNLVTAERMTAASIAVLRTEWLVSPRVQSFDPAAFPGDQRWNTVWLGV
ncbi:MAG: ABC transporter substrate-binding protein [Actinomycetota bacterium]|nr:ABC transporter substrate-binding protein [Actinomycetota bacterium]